MQKRITIPTPDAGDGFPVHYEGGGFLLNLSQPQLEAIVRQGLPLLSEDERREIAAETYEDLEEQALPEPETALDASEVEAIWFAIRQCRTISDGKIRHRACDRAAAALRRLSGTSEPGTASPATDSRRSAFGAVVDLAIAIKGNPAAADALGVKADDYGLDVAEAVARWAKSYRAPETLRLDPSVERRQALRDLWGSGLPEPCRHGHHLTCPECGPGPHTTDAQWERDTLEARVSGLESEVKTLRADLEGLGQRAAELGRRSAEALEGVIAQVATLENPPDRGPSGN